MGKAVFGKAPSGERLERMMKSPNYKDGAFQNKNFTPQLAEGYTMRGVIYMQLFKSNPHKKPVDIIPSQKTNLLELPIEEDVLVWFGHSSYFIQVDGKKILVDPVFSDNASPVGGTNKAFKGSNVYTVNDLPDIDYLFISHDHYDHLDYATILQLKSKVKTIIGGSGVGSHFEYWGYDPSIVIEKNWDDTIDLDNGFIVHITPARHFSGRGVKRNNTLWCSFLLQSPTMKIYLGGDSGYDTHFAEIGTQFGPIDFAILENGQYDDAWCYIHMRPFEVLKAARDLQVKRLLPAHSSKFALANHPWDEPLIKITELNKETKIPLVTPMIGEKVYLKNIHQEFKQWWIGVK